MGEWFSESKDVNAPLIDFLKGLPTHKKGQEKEEADEFISGALPVYEEERKNIRQNKGNPTVFVDYCYRITLGGAQLILDSALAVHQGGRNPNKLVGKAWGFFMAFIHYGITDEDFTISHLNLLREDIIRIVKFMNGHLNKIFGHGKHLHVRDRLLTIANSGGLPPEKKALIEGLAQIFAS